MEIKIEEWELGPHSPLCTLCLCVSPSWMHMGPLQPFHVAPIRYPPRNQSLAPSEMRWTERGLNGIFINFINTSTKQKQDSFIDLNIKITCAFFAFSQR